MARYTQEQIDQANSIDLEEYLMNRGEKLQQAGREARFIYTDADGEHDSVSIRGNRWYDHKNQIGGYPVKFLQEFFGLRFQEAVEELLNENPSAVLKQKNRGMAKKEEKQAQKELILPEKVKNMKRLFAYLTKTRFISRDVVKAFVDQKLIYQEEKYNNIVFVGTDQDGKVKCASMKSTGSNAKSFRQTISGSDCDYGFCWRGTGNRLFVFESAVDMMSFATLFSENWQEQNYLSLDGTSPRPLLRFLEERKDLAEIYICTDFDPAGIEAYWKFRDQLMERGYKEEMIFRLYPSFKDWNEQLKSMNGVNPILPQPHPKPEEYRRIAQKLERLNENDDLPYNKWKAQQFEKDGMDFFKNRITKEWKAARTAADKQDPEAVTALEASITRIADLSICGICALTGISYSDTASELSEEYRPHKDKNRLSARLGNLKKEMDQMKKAKNNQELFSRLKTIADTAIRANVYLKLEYPLEMERRNSFREKQDREQAAEQKESPAEEERQSMKMEGM